MLGRTFALRSGVLSIIGVAPEWFFGETVGERPDAWVPLAMQAAVLPGRDWLHDKPGSVEKVMWLHVFGRLRPGVSRDTAQANANVVFQQGLAATTARWPIRTAQGVSRTSASWCATRPPARQDPRQLRRAARRAAAAAGLVLLIACSNLGNLLLARATARSRRCPSGSPSAPAAAASSDSC